MYNEGMWEIAWRQADRSGAITVKRKAFKTEKARTAFAQRLESKASFIAIVAYSDPA